MNILITNDDGIASQGLRFLYELLYRTHNVAIIAPIKEMSGCSHSITLRRRLKLKQITDSIYSITGTPTDCVVLGINSILEKRPNLIISGINAGPNLGFDVTYSGTVGAALEGAIERIPSFAISITGHRNFEDTSGIILRLISFLKKVNTAGFFFNVNVPPEPKGVRVTKLGRRSYQNVITTHKSSFEIGGTPVHAISDGETDVEAIDNGYTSITPISLDLVDYNIFKELSSLNEGLRKKWPKQRNA